MPFFIGSSNIFNVPCSRLRARQGVLQTFFQGVDTEQKRECSNDLLVGEWGWFCVWERFMKEATAEQGLPGGGKGRDTPAEKTD